MSRSRNKKLDKMVFVLYMEDTCLGGTDGSYRHHPQGRAGSRLERRCDDRRNERGETGMSRARRENRRSSPRSKSLLGFVVTRPGR